MENIESIIKYTSKLKLLYVEDNSDARTATLSILEEFFDDIIIAVDGEDGFDKFNKNSIDLIITDINMPRLSGIEMLKKIRKFDKEISVLILSAYNETGYFMDSIKLEVQGYLIKPIDIEQFSATLNKVVEKFMLKDSAQRNLSFLKQYQELTDRSSIISKTDAKGIITYANEQFCDISGYSQEELLGKSHNIIRHPDMPTEAFKNLWEIIKNKKQIWQGIVKNKKKNGQAYYVKATIKPILDEDGEIVEYIALRDNITEIMNPKRQFHDYVDTIKNPMVALVKVEGLEDIEKFYGQRLLQSIEEKLSSILNDIVSRYIKFEHVFVLGGCEYAFACDKDGLNISLEEVCAGLLEFRKTVQNTTLTIDHIDCDISLRISFASGNKVVENIRYGMDRLIKTNGDFILANNLAKEEQYRARQNLQILKTVKSAIDNYRIISYFQPIVNNNTKRIEKYESLVRLIDDEDKVMSPFSFLDVAKRGIYYSEITNIVLKNSFNSLKNTTKEISINLSVLDIERESTREKIYEFLEIYKEDASRVVFELLEDENVKDFEVIREFIQKVKELGVQIAIDDFGSGYSNFERIVDYQPNILKIDGSLIKNIETSQLSLSVVKTVIAFAKEQGIKIVAEYVENENIYNILKDLGVDYSQGYYFGKPDLLKES